MTELSSFVGAGALLLAAVLALLLRPLLRARGPAEGTGQAGQADAPARREANLAILRDQLAELEREHADGLLADTDFAQARNELQRRLHAEQLQFGQAQTQQAAVQVPGYQTLGTQSQ